MNTNNNEITRKGLMFVLSSPSGAGKTSLSRKLLELDNELFLSISYTTRPPRPGEIDGEDYFFVDNDDFELMREKDEFLEYAQVFDYYYGTPRKPVEKILAMGRDILFDIKRLLVSDFQFQVVHLMKVVIFLLFLYLYRDLNYQ